MRKLFAVSVVTLLCLISQTKEVQAWGPEYDSGKCEINTGRKVIPFACDIERGGGAGGYYMIISTASEGKIGTYQMDTSLNPPPDEFIWSNGNQEVVRGAKWGASSWTFWTQKGWAVSFQKTNEPMD